MKELIIDKKTRLNKIKDKESYTKLILNTKVNPKDLKDFINVNDLTIKRYSERGYNVYNERHINKLSFKENIEKLTLDSIYNYGADKNYDVGWHLLLPNLKEITFINCIHSIDFGYLEKCSSLEKINIYTDFMRYSDNPRFDVKNTNLQEIVIDQKYKFKFEYIPIRVSYRFDIDDSIKLSYKNLSVISNVIIDSNNNIISKKHSLDMIFQNVLQNKTLFIPDYVTNIAKDLYMYVSKEDINIISLNVNLLKTQAEKVNVLGKSDLKMIKKIELRSNNEMSLFERREINIEGDLKKLYIENNKLYIITDKKIILINKDGKETINKIKDYEIKEKEEYIYYKKLVSTLKDNNNEELNNALNIVEKELIKKLTK